MVCVVRGGFGHHLHELFDRGEGSGRVSSGSCLLLAVVWMLIGLFSLRVIACAFLYLAVVLCVNWQWCGFPDM